ncbi:hypothetical protein AAMO2058_001758200, partial [Amorphochlora amoebiformis]
MGVASQTGAQPPQFPPKEREGERKMCSSRKFCFSTAAMHVPDPMRPNAPQKKISDEDDPEIYPTGRGADAPSANGMSGGDQNWEIWVSRRRTELKNDLLRLSTYVAQRNEALRSAGILTPEFRLQRFLFLATASKVARKQYLQYENSQAIFEANQATEDLRKSHEKAGLEEDKYFRRESRRRRARGQDRLGGAGLISGNPAVAREKKERSDFLVAVPSSPDTKMMNEDEESEEEKDVTKAQIEARQARDAVKTPLVHLEEDGDPDLDEFIDAEALYEGILGKKSRMTHLYKMRYYKLIRARQKNVLYLVSYTKKPQDGGLPRRVVARITPQQKAMRCEDDEEGRKFVIQTRNKNITKHIKFRAPEDYECNLWIEEINEALDNEVEQDAKRERIGNRFIGWEFEQRATGEVLNQMPGTRTVAKWGEEGLEQHEHQWDRAVATKLMTKCSELYVRARDAAEVIKATRKEIEERLANQNSKEGDGKENQ